MFKSYLKTAYRNIIKYKYYSLINILGLAFGITCCMLIFLYAKYELGYDRFHKNADQIYRIVKQSIKNNRIDRSTGTPAPLAAALVEEYPEILDAVRIDKPGYKIFVKDSGDWIYEKNFIFTDSSFFKIFSFFFLKGNRETALLDPSSIVITERIAKKYFKNENPMGKLITFKRSFSWIMGFMGMEDKPLTFKVSGVLKNIQGNSHLKFDFIAPFKTYNSFYLNQWNAWNFKTYILINRYSNPVELEKKFPGFLQKYRKKKSDNLKLYLQSLTGIHLHSNIRGEMAPGGSIGNLYLFSLISLIILLIACINYMNLSTALSIRRTKEVGVRKVLGAGHKDIIIRFVGESILISFISLPLAILLTHIILPIFNNIIGAEIKIDYKELLPFFPWLLILILVVGIITGLFPSLFVSKFQPGIVLKEIFKGRQKKTTRSIFVIIQFAFSIFFFLCTIIGWKQIDFIQSKNLGVSKETIIRIPIHSKEILDNIGPLKNELLKVKNVIDVTASSFSLDDSIERTSTWWEGQPTNLKESANGISIDSHFIDTFGIKLKAGRNLTNDDDMGIIINESMVKKIGWKSPQVAIGKKFKYGSYINGQIVGVVNDFHYRSLHQAIKPLVLFNGRNFKYFYNFFIKIHPSNIQEMLDNIKEIWNRFDPNQLFEFLFTDETLKRLYQKESRIQNVFQYASFLSIFIACIGLIGMVTLYSEQQTKEIGIRKAFGANTTDILFMFFKETIIWVLLANLIAWPIAYIFMYKWMQNFVLRTGIGILPFLLAGFFSLVISLVAVSYQSFKSASLNPAETLRYE
jgi:putative ABC transport system permease protein